MREAGLARILNMAAMVAALLGLRAAALWLDLGDVAMQLLVLVPFFALVIGVSAVFSALHTLARELEHEMQALIACVGSDMPLAGNFMPAAMAPWIAGHVAEFQAHLAKGNSLLAAGRVREALGAYRVAIKLAPDAGIGYYNLGIALRRARDWPGAALAFRSAARRDPRDFDAVQNVVATIATAVRKDAPALFTRAPPPACDAHAPVSIVVCTLEPRKLEAMQANFRAALDGRAHEFIVIRDARSLSEGYARGLRMARHDVVVFSHDDVELVSPRPFDAIAHALQRHDVVGLAGSRLVSGPAVMWAGHPHLHGHVAYPDAGRDFQATVFSLECGLLDGMQALDGMLIAARRAAALRIGFDERTFDGFHFYDLDFTYRAHLAGLSVAVTTDVTAIHASNGEFGDEWRRGAHRFVAKFPGMNAPVGSHHAYAARLESRPKVARFYEELRGLAATP